MPDAFLLKRNENSFWGMKLANGTQIWQNSAQSVSEIQQFQSDRMYVKLNGELFAKHCAPATFA